MIMYSKFRVIVVIHHLRIHAFAGIAFSFRYRSSFVRHYALFTKRVLPTKMGVTGLLQTFKEIQKPTLLSEFKGKTLAVDTYGWLHRGLISCAQDLCTNSPTRSYVTSVIKKVDMLRHFGVEPFMVFDGAPLPTKEGTEKERQQRREKAREQALAFQKKGDRRLAWKEYMKAADVTPEMAKSVMVELQRKHVKYVVAPYEADSQMVYLEKSGVVDGILSEDSDLLIFGASRLLTKLNDYGECVEINRADFHLVKSLPYLHQLTHSQLRLVVILAGCDYTKGIPGVGLKTAFTLIKKHGLLNEVIAALANEKKSIPENFLEEAVKADLAFQFQKVFNPATGLLCTLSVYPETLDVDHEMVELCCGRTLEPHLHQGICTGKLHPDTHDLLVSREQSLVTMSRSSSMVVRLNTKVETSIKSKSFGPSIESYFKVENKENIGSFKRIVEKSPTAPKLSPISKKIKRTAAVGNSGAQSKFFAKNTSKSHPPSSPSSLLTGDSDFPELSPIKTKTPSAESKLEILSNSQEEYLTDADDQVDGFKDSRVSPPVQRRTNTMPLTSDDGAMEDFEESPVKLAKVGLDWRAKFQYSEGPKTSGPISSEESELFPNTPVEDISELGTQSQVKSLQREELLLSDDSDIQNVIVHQQTTFSLSKFAFTGR